MNPLTMFIITVYVIAGVAALAVVGLFVAAVRLVLKGDL